MPDEVSKEQGAEQLVVPATPSAEEASPAQVNDFESVDDKEPGGEDPQAVRARREYRARKRAEAEREDERRRNIALEVRLRALQEERQPKDPPQVRHTPQQLQAAIDAGTISYAEAADYLAEQRAKEHGEVLLKQERQRADNEYRVFKAQEVVDAYTSALPWLHDKNDGRRRSLETEYARLIDPNGIYRLPDSPATESLVLEKVLGPLDKIKAKAQVDSFDRSNRDAHFESAAGGGANAQRGNAANKQVDTVPQHMKDFWDKTQTSQAERVKEAEYWHRLRGKK